MTIKDNSGRKQIILRLELNSSKLAPKPLCDMSIYQPSRGAFVESGHVAFIQQAQLDKSFLSTLTLALKLWLLSEYLRMGMERVIAELTTLHT